VAVLVTELIKLPLSTALLCYEMRSISAAVGQLWNDIALQPFDTLKISIPALLYTIQNNALFVAVGNLEAAVFQVTYQLKTLTTAVLTVVLLGRRQQAHQWFALVLLTAGAAMVQEPKKVKPAANPDGATSASTLMVGLAATILACVCSSVASVYLEKILTESKPSIWVRNAQLCLFTIPVAFLGTRMAEDEHIKEDGTPLHGFDTVVWAAIFTNALGGMLVATVMKFAGNILRNFAQASAIIVGGLGSWLFFGFQITMPFVGGVGLVILSIFIYGSKAELVTLWIHRVRAHADPLNGEVPVPGQVHALPCLHWCCSPPLASSCCAAQGEPRYVPDGELPSRRTDEATHRWGRRRDGRCAVGRWTPA
jgi:UDP-sugar transporter A1/2/3